MRTVIKLDVTDAERSSIYELSTGGKKGLATRKMVTEYVQGCVTGSHDAIAGVEGTDCSTGSCPSPRSFVEAALVPVMPEPYATQYKDRSDVWKASWLKAWSDVGRRLSK